MMTVLIYGWPWLLVIATGCALLWRYHHVVDYAPPVTHTAVVWVRDESGETPIYEATIAHIAKHAAADLDAEWAAISDAIDGAA